MKNLEDYEQIKLVISDKQDIITCTIEVPAVCSYFPHRVEISTDMVRQTLSRKGYEFYSLLEGGSISNKSETSNLRQTWKFMKNKPKQEKTPVKKTRTTKRRTSRANLKKED